MSYPELRLALGTKRESGRHCQNVLEHWICKAFSLHGSLRNPNLLRDNPQKGNSGCDGREPRSGPGSDSSLALSLADFPSEIPFPFLGSRVKSSVCASVAMHVHASGLLPQVARHSAMHLSTLFYLIATSSLWA